MSLPLEGVRIVEDAQYVAGPLAGVLLADAWLHPQDLIAAGMAAGADESED